MQVSQLQRLFFKHWPQLYDLALANCAAASAPDGLRRALRELNTEELRQLMCKQLRLVGEDDPWAQVREQGGVCAAIESCSTGTVMQDCFLLL